MAFQPPPLTGIKVLEFAGLAPGPFAGLLLADAGASVLRIDRAVAGSTTTTMPTADLLARHKASIAVDLKSRGGSSLVRALARRADVVIDPFRPGVLERLGLGPDELVGLNPRLVYGRLTGFRRDGRYRDMAGHDINYLAVSGVLDLLGRAGQKPTPPANMLADFAGGGAALFQGVLLALLARERNGRGQVVEAAMVDGAAYLATLPRLGLRTAAWDQPRGENLLDSGCPYYDTYETADGGHVAVGALEPRFFRRLLEGLGLADRGWEEGRHDRARWDELRRLLARAFSAGTRAHWEAVFDGTDACCTPVLAFAELEADPAREGDQRPAVTLRDSPCLAVCPGAAGPSQGQGPGVEGGGYVGRRLSPGQGGEDLLREWFGWEMGAQFDVVDGGLALRETSRL